MNQKGFAPILIVLLIAVLGIGGYFVYRNYSQYSTKTPSSTTQPTTSPSLTASTPAPTDSGETSNWKTYTNKEYGYSLKYPIDKFVQFACPEDEKDYFYLGKKDPSTKNTEVVNMLSCARDSRYTLEIRAITSQMSVPVSNKYETITVENIVVDGISAKKYNSVKTSVNSPYPEWYTQIIFVRDGVTYDIYFGAKPLEETFNHILSTFKFTL